MPRKAKKTRQYKADKFPSVRDRIKPDFLKIPGVSQLSDTNLEALIEYVVPRQANGEPASGHFDRRFIIRQRTDSGEFRARKGTPRVSLNHWLRSGCETDALTPEFPMKLFKQKNYWKQAGWEQQKGTKGKGPHLPLGTISQKYKRQQLEKFGRFFNVGQEKAPKYIEGLKDLYPAGTREEKCTRIKNKFYDRSGQGWKDMHDQDTLERLFKQWDRAGRPGSITPTASPRRRQDGGAGGGAGGGQTTLRTQFKLVVPGPPGPPENQDRNALNRKQEAMKKFWKLTPAERRNLINTVKHERGLSIAW